jgi:hypothetical protein
MRDVVKIPQGLPPDIGEAYRQAAEKSVLASLNPKVFFGYFSVCADGQGHGGNTTYPGLDWGQTAEALLWLGRREEVLASWEYVKGFQREDGLLPFAILPDLAGKTVPVDPNCRLTVAHDGAVFDHWVPGNPLRTLANVTSILLLDSIYRNIGDAAWLARQTDMLRRAVSWLMNQITPEGLVHGGGFYVERPVRLEYDGVNQCYTAHALRLAAGLLRATADAPLAESCETVARKIVSCFRERFWAGDHCVEYIHPERGAIRCHGLTDVDWAAIAMDIVSEEQRDVLWPQLQNHPGFLYQGMPTGIATLPETYEDWEVEKIDRHDVAAMGRVWYLEAWARARMNDRDGILQSIRRVARAGRENNWYWWERYYSERTGSLARYSYNTYVEYPANLIRIVHRFL